MTSCGHRVLRLDATVNKLFITKFKKFSIRQAIFIILIISSFCSLKWPIFSQTGKIGTGKMDDLSSFSEWQFSVLVK